MKLKIRIYVCVLTIFTSMTLTACSIIPKEEQFRTASVIKEYEGNEFSMTAVKRGDICNYQNISCEYKASNTQSVSLDEWIMVKSVNVKAGEKVKAGDVLVEIMSDEVDANIDEIKYNIKKKQTQIIQSERMKQLEIKKQKLILNDEVSIKAIEENHDVEIAGYKSEITDMQSQLDYAIEEQKNYQYTAEFDGVVTYVNENAVGFDYGAMNDRKGGFRQRGSKIVTISDGSMPCFIADKDSSEYISKLTENQTITVSTVADEYETKVHFSKDEPDKVYFLLDYIPNNIDDGNIANAEYVLEEKKDVLYLPDSAVKKMGDSNIVYYEDENGLKNVKEIQIGLAAENKVEIVSGLEFGDAVIVR